MFRCGRNRKIGKRLNIAIVSQEFPPYTNWGGIASYNYAFANAYSKFGHHITVISRMSRGAPEFEETENGIKIWRIGRTVFRKYFLGRTIDKILYSKSVYKKTKELDDINAFDVIETTEAGLEAEILLSDPLFSDRVVIQCNGSNSQTVIPDGPFSFLNRIDASWSLKREIDSLRLAKNVLVTSESTRKVLLSNGIVSSNIKLIYQGIDVDRFEPAKSKVPDSPLKVGFVGRLEKTKGIDFVWQVIDRIDPTDGITFHFKGAIHWTSRKDTEQKFEQFSELAVYHRPGDQADMPAYYQGLHVLLQPSHFENFGLVYVEGMASKLIVFAGMNGGGSEIIMNNITGFVIDPNNDVDLVVEKLKNIASDLSSYEEMADRAREDVIKKYSLEACARQKIAYYNQI